MVDISTGILNALANESLKTQPDMNILESYLKILKRDPSKKKSIRMLLTPHFQYKSPLHQSRDPQITARICELFLRYGISSKDILEYYVEYIEKNPPLAKFQPVLNVLLKARRRKFDASDNRAFVMCLQVYLKHHENSDLAILRKFLDAGADPNFISSENGVSFQSPLMDAVLHDYIELVHLLLHYRAKAYIEQTNGNPMDHKKQQRKNMTPYVLQIASERVRKVVSKALKPSKNPPKKLVISKKNMQQGITDWKGTAYVGIGRARYDGKNTDMQSYLSNAQLGEYMRTKALRAPATPPGMGTLPKYVYRGMHGLQAKTLLQQKYIDLKSYVAVSRSYKVAYKFSFPIDKKSEHNVLVHIKLSTIPEGTPWVWYFGKQSSVRNDRYNEGLLAEEEIVLPPGRITLRKKRNGHLNEYIAEYTPDASATSIFSKKRIIQRLGPARRNVHNTTPVPKYMMNLFDQEKSGVRKSRKSSGVSAT